MTAREQLLENGLVCSRGQSGAYVNLPHLIVRHSPTGFEWGYGGSGPAELALNCLWCMLEPPACALHYWTDVEQRELTTMMYQTFKFDMIATIPRSGGSVPADLICHWIAEEIEERLQHHHKFNSHYRLIAAFFHEVFNQMQRKKGGEDSGKRSDEPQTDQAR